jgi:hypothetical protein
MPPEALGVEAGEEGAATGIEVVAIIRDEDIGATRAATAGNDESSALI